MHGLPCAKNNGFSRSRSHSLPLGSLSFRAEFRSVRPRGNPAVVSAGEHLTERTLIYRQTPVRITAVRFGTDYWGAERFLRPGAATGGMLRTEVLLELGAGASARAAVTGGPGLQIS